MKGRKTAALGFGYALERLADETIRFKQLQPLVAFTRGSNAADKPL